MRRCRGSAPRTCSQRPRTPDRRRASSIAIASMLRQYIAIQLVPSDCSRWPPVGSGRAAIENADVVEAEEAALEHVVAFGVLAVHPPGEVQQQLVEDALEERAIADAAPLLLDLVDAPRRPGVHRRVHVAERPFVRGQLPVRDACTTRAAAGSAAPWRTRSRPARAARSGTRGPTRRTTGTPTCRASRSRRRCTGAATRGSGPCSALAGGAGWPGSPSSQSVTT